MSKLFSFRLLGLMCLVLSIGFVSSCDKDDDDDVVSDKIQLFSFGPTGARHGDTLHLCL